MKRGIVVISAISGAFILCITTIFIVGAWDSTPGGKQEAKTTAGNADISSFFQYVPSDPRQSQIALPTTIVAPTDVALPPPETKDNLTDQLAYLFTANLAQGAASAEEAMLTAQRDVSGLVTYELFSADDIITTSDNSLPAQKRYLESYRDITRDYFETDIKALEERFVATQDVRVLEPLSAPISGILTSLLATPVPSAWAQIHLMLLDLWQREQTIYDALARYEDDPLKAILAMQELPGIVQMSQSIQTKLTEYYSTLAS